MLRITALLLLASSFLAQAAQNPFIQSQTAAAVRNNYSGYVGMQFTVGATAINVTSLGRIYLAGNSRTHNVKFVNAATGIDVPGGSVQLTMVAGTANSYQYATLPAPVQLAPGTAYFLLSQELIGGDNWYDITPITSTSDGLVNGPVYQEPHGKYRLVSLAPPSNRSYVPLNFKYGLAGPAPTVTIGQPTANAALSGSVNITASASAASGLGVTSVMFKLNGSVPIGAALTAAPYQVTLDTTGFIDGTYALSATAIDTNGNQASTSVPISLANGNVLAGATSFARSATSGTLRNNYSGFVGMQFSIGAQPLTINSLGRIFVAGNTATHTVKLVNASTDQDVPGGSAQVAMAGGTPLQFNYAPLPYALTLPAGGSYYLLSEETNGGDQWYDDGPLSVTGVATLPGAIYYSGFGYVLVSSSPGNSYVPLSFLYGGSSAHSAPTVAVTSPAQGNVLGTVTFSAVASSATLLQIKSLQLMLDGAPFGSADTTPAQTAALSLSLPTFNLSSGGHTLSAVATDSAGQSTTAAGLSIIVNNSGTSPVSFLVTNQMLSGALRSDFTGDVGMELQVGNSPITVSQLGRYCAPGNFQIHILKLVQSNDVDVPGGLATVPMAGCAAGTYSYGPLASPVQLQANTSYFLVSLEMAGGDQWYNYGQVISTSAATIAGPVYSTNSGYIVVPAPGDSYMPVNLQYQIATTAAPSISITSPSANATLALTSTITANAVAASGLSISSVQFQQNGQNIGTAVTASGTVFSTQIDTTTLPDGTYNLSAIATDSAGNSATAAPVMVTVSNAASPASQAAADAAATAAANAAANAAATAAANTAAATAAANAAAATAAANAAAATAAANAAAATAAANAAAATAAANAAAATAAANAAAATAAATGNPVVTITSPAFLSTISGTINLTANVTAAPGLTIANVQFQRTGTNLGPLVTGPGPTFTLPVDTRLLQDGAYNFTAIAKDSAGNVTFSIGDTVTIANNLTPPSVKVTTPAPGLSASGMLSVTATAVPAPGTTVASMQLLVDGANFGAPCAAASCTASFDTSVLPNGSHRLTATAADSDEGHATAPAVAFTTNNPVIGIGLLNGFLPGVVRNYGDWIGMQFTTNCIPITVTALGRIFVPGNTGTHQLKLVNASDGSDVPGGSATISFTGAVANRISYAPLAAPITLPANTAYYLVSQESLTGDQFYDVEPILTMGAATVNGPAYVQSGQWVTPPNPNYMYEPLDFKFTVPGVPFPAAVNPSGGSPSATKGVAITPAANNHLLVTGQSLSTGSTGGPALSLTQPYSNQMLTRDNSAFLPLVEGSWASNVESIGSAMGNSLTFLSPNFNDVVTNAGLGGASYLQLAQGTAPYAKAIAQLNGAKTLSAAAGKTYKVSGVAVLHGETDEAEGTTAAAYEADLVQWQTNYQTDGRAISGQSDSVPFFIDQENSWTYSDLSTPVVALAQLSAAEDNPSSIFLIGPKYQYHYNDGIHIDNVGYREEGEQFGKAIKQVLVDGKYLKPFAPKSITRSGNLVTVVFNVPSPPLQFDTYTVLPKSAMGFEYSDGSGCSAFIVSAQITAGDTVTLTLSSLPNGSNEHVRYAITGIPEAPAGRDQPGAPRGNLKDSDPTVSLYGNDLSNWAVAFDKTVSPQ